MQANKAFYVIGAIVVLVISLMLWFLFGSGSSARPANEKVDVIDAAFKDLSPEELREMGIEGDTPRDTIKTLVGNSKANNKKIEEVINQNEQLLSVKNHQNQETKRIWDLAGKNGIKWAGIIENRGFAVHCPFFYA